MSKPKMVKWLMSFSHFKLLITFNHITVALSLFAAITACGCASSQKNAAHLLYEQSTVGVDRFATAGGYNIHYVESGTGRPVVLIPGAFSTYRVWSRLIPALSREFHVIAVDYAGVGDSDKPGSDFDYSVRAQADIIAELINSLNLGKVRLAGVSYGSSIALNIAARYPQLVQNVVCVEGGAFILPEQLNHSKSTALLGIPILGDLVLEIMKSGLFDKVAAKEIMGDAWDKLELADKEMILKLVNTNLQSASRSAWYHIYRAITRQTDFTQELTYSSVPIKYLYGEQSKYLKVSKTNADIIRSIALNAEIISFDDGIHDLELQYPGKVVDAIAGSWDTSQIASDKTANSYK
ncbi:MAG TPA: alpha/beta hydrolase [Dissulfurispiraceae bacterium]|nr:alpha/beta hydrolase [Dissulfurispiraceae bacterium]